VARALSSQRPARQSQRESGLLERPRSVRLRFSQRLGDSTWSSVAPPLTAVPYAIANNLPFNLVTGFDLTDSQIYGKTSTFFFTGGQFSNQKVLLAWSFQFVQPTIVALLTSYNAAQLAPPADVWPPTDYDTIWTVKLDAQGNLRVNNTMCEGIDSAALPTLPPQF
jgi:hypothetical protein